jgi:hypothetical protein
MEIKVDFWHLVGLLLMFLGFCFAGARILLAQFERHLDTRFKAHAEKLAEIKEASVREAERIAVIEQELRDIQIQLPQRYVAREDYVRNQSVIEAKLDAMAVRFENLILRIGNLTRGDSQ